MAAPIFAARAATASFGVGCDQARLNLKIRAARALPSAARSNREHAVLGWAARGKGNGVIAEILGISDHTVDTLMR